MSGSSSSSNHVRITADNQGPILAIVTWFFMVMMIFATIFRVVIKLFVRRRLEADDYVVGAALAFAVAQSIVISVSLRDGLGQRKSNLSADKLDSVEKTVYTSNILFVLSYGMAKISITLLLRRLVAYKPHKMVASVNIGLTIAWMVASVVALAVQCGVHEPWNTQNGHCFNQFTFWAAIAPIDLITELVIIALPVFMVMPLQLALSKKTAVVLAFAFRFGVVVVVVIRLALLHSYFASTSDFILDFVPSGVVTQILISVSITTACVPALKPFLDSFDSGMLNVGLKRAGFNGQHSHSYELQSKSKLTSSAAANNSHKRAENTKYLAAITGSRNRDVGRDSFDSGKSNEMIIKRTQNWTVQYETRAESTEPSTLSVAPSSTSSEVLVIQQ